jgi:hypothetical protein
MTDIRSLLNSGTLGNGNLDSRRNWFRISMLALAVRGLMVSGLRKIRLFDQHVAYQTIRDDLLSRYTFD